ncbi:MAG: hypothetical protein IPO00_17725 [Betaproteobacteria bacterium]|nr:hypothetical protein [Betaproteobacteria bacterium]
MVDAGSSEAPALSASSRRKQQQGLFGWAARKACLATKTSLDAARQADNNTTK